MSNRKKIDKGKRGGGGGADGGGGEGWTFGIRRRSADSNVSLINYKTLFIMDDEASTSSHGRLKVWKLFF
jgi:hypothetical protein